MYINFRKNVQNALELTADGSVKKTPQIAVKTADNDTLTFPDDFGDLHYEFSDEEIVIWSRQSDRKIIKLLRQKGLALDRLAELLGNNISRAAKVYREFCKQSHRKGAGFADGRTKGTKLHLTGQLRRNLPNVASSSGGGAGGRAAGVHQKLRTSMSRPSTTPSTPAQSAQSTPRTAAAAVAAMRSTLPKSTGGSGNLHQSTATAAAAAAAGAHRAKGRKESQQRSGWTSTAQHSGGGGGGSKVTVAGESAKPVDNGAAPAPAAAADEAAAAPPRKKISFPQPVPVAASVFLAGGDATSPSMKIAVDMENNTVLQGGQVKFNMDRILPVDASLQDLYQDSLSPLVHVGRSSVVVVGIE